MKETYVDGGDKAFGPWKKNVSKGRESHFKGEFIGLDQLILSKSTSFYIIDEPARGFEGFEALKTGLNWFFV